MAYTRRNFLGHSLLASGSLLIPKFLKGFENPMAMSLGLNEKALVVIQLSGGNDGLNTIVPYGNDIYYQLRPGIGLKKEKLVQINDDFAFNKGLAPLQSLYDDGLFTIINGVGYPNPDLSHFRSMDIWQTGSGSESFYDTGWLGRYLDAQCSATCPAHLGVEADGYLSLAMKGEKVNGIATPNPERLLHSLRDPYLADVVNAHSSGDDETNVEYLYKVMRDTYSSAEYLADKTKLYNSKQVYPDTSFASKLKTVASLITAHADSKVYYVSTSGFDTHVNQVLTQEKALINVAGGLRAFTDDIKEAGRLKDVVVMVFSEFGRRVSQNASGGTDHGTANNVWIISGSLKKKGFYNPLPELNALHEGNFKYSIDFRSVYATLLKNWLTADDKMILQNKFKHLDFI